MATGLGQNPGTSSSLTFHTRFEAFHFFFLSLGISVVPRTPHGDQQLRSAANDQLLSAMDLRHLASKCQSRVQPPSLTHWARDVTFSADDECLVAACSLMKRPRSWAENFPTTMSIINFYKNGEENLFFLKDSHELGCGCVSRRNCTIILKLLILPIKYRLALRHSAHFVNLLSMLPTVLPPFFSDCTRIILRATHTSFREKSSSSSS